MRQSGDDPMTQENITNLSVLPRDMYVISATRDSGGIVCEATMCSVPMALGPEVRYVRADYHEEALLAARAWSNADQNGQELPRTGHILK